MRKTFLRRVMAAGFFLVPLSVMAGGMSVYDSTGQPGAKDVRVQVSYPKGFESREAGYDRIRQFIRKSGELEEILIVHAIHHVNKERVEMILPVAGALPQQARYYLWGLQLSGKNKWLHEMRDTKADGRPAVFLAGADITRNKGKPWYSRIEVLAVYDGENMIMLSCRVAGPKERKAAVEKRYAKSRKTVCRPFLESLRLMQPAQGKEREVHDRMDDEMLQIDESSPGAFCHSDSGR